MYIPKANLNSDKDEIVAFMKQFSFATIVTSKDNFPIATHLPFIVRLENNEVILTSHFAIANEHWKEIENHQNLIIFTEPHAYISTKNYDKELNVPTWNYISVHAYGKGKIISDSTKVAEILEKTIENYEFSFQNQWKNFPEEYKEKMSKGIVAFEISVLELQGKYKLSQNRTETEKSKIIESLSNSTNTSEKLIADYMKKGT